MPSSRTRSWNWRYAGLGLALVLLATVGAVTAWSFERTSASFDWVEHTHEVMSTLQDYRTAIRRAESSARGYRLTGRNTLRDDLLRQTAPIEMSLQQLTIQLADNPAQVARARQLRKVTDKRLALSLRLATPVAAMDEQRIMAEGVASMAAIDALSGRMLLVERELLKQRRAHMRREAWLLIAFTGGGTALAIMLLVWLMRGLQQETRRSRRLEDEARRALSDLNTSVANLAQLSEQRGVLSRYASLLQSCQGVQEALRVSGHVLAELLPGSGGRCYLMRASQDLVETAAVFGTPAVASTDLLKPLDCWALRKGQPYTVESVATGVACTHLDVSAAAPGAWSVCMPLLAQGTPLGLLQVTGQAHQDREKAQAMLEIVAEHLGLALVNLQLRDTLRMQSLRDSLTGLFNRRYLDESLQREITRCERRGLPLAVMMIDIDHFKSFNDTHGHGAGDALLANIGKLLQLMTRSEDLACRYGGEEFTIVLPETARDSAMHRAEEIRIAVGQSTVQYMRQTIGPCTASIGLAMLPEDGDSPEVLMSRADHALYRAKSQGRNRVVEASHGVLPTAFPEPSPAGSA